MHDSHAIKHIQSCTMYLIADDKSLALAFAAGYLAIVRT